MPRLSRAARSSAGLRRSTPPPRWASTGASRARRVATSSASSRGRGPAALAIIFWATVRSSGNPSRSSSQASSSAADSAQAVSTANGVPPAAVRGLPAAVRGSSSRRNARSCVARTTRASSAKRAARCSRPAGSPRPGRVHVSSAQSRRSWPSPRTGSSGSSPSAASSAAASRSSCPPRAALPSPAGGGSPRAAAHTAPGSSRRPPCNTRWTAARSQQTAGRTPAATSGAAVLRADHHTHRGAKAASTWARTADGSQARTAQQPRSDASPTPAPATTTTATGSRRPTPAACRPWVTSPAVSSGIPIRSSSRPWTLRRGRGLALAVVIRPDPPRHAGRTHRELTVKRSRSTAGAGRGRWSAAPGRRGGQEHDRGA